MGTYGKGFLGEATVRLARLLGIEGQIPIELAKSIQPVVILGDGTQPGMGGQENRRWSLYVDIIGAVTSTNFAIRPQDDLIIDRIVWSMGNASTSVRVNYIGPNGADPFTIATKKANFLDRNNGSELAPMLHGMTGAVAITGTEWWRARSSATANAETDMMINPFLMVRGSRLFFWINGNVSGTMHIQGRTV